MNKRFSTLLTAGLLMAGALFSSAKADDAFAVFGSDAKIANGVKVYLADDATPTTGVLNVKTVTTDDKVAYTVVGATTASLAGTPASVFVIDGVAKELGGVTFLLKDIKGNVIKLQTSGDAVDNAKNNTMATKFFVDNEKLANISGIKLANATEGDEVLTIDGNSGSVYGYAEATGNLKAIKFFTAASKTLTATELNAALSDGFSFAFSKEVEGNVFGEKIFAVEMPAAGSNGCITNVAAGTYFTTSGGKDLAAAIAASATTDGTDADVIAAFKAATFIAADPVATWGITALDSKAGLGLKFTKVKGDKLNIASDGAGLALKGEGKLTIHVNNACFTVEESDALNAMGEFTAKLASVYAVTDKTASDGAGTFASKSDIYVAAYAPLTGNTTYVTTNTTATTVSFSSQSWASADKFLSDAKSVVSIYVTTGDNKAKYLISEVSSSDYKYKSTKEMETVNKIAGQWIVTNFFNNELTLKNRLTAAPVTVQLYVTDNANEYKLAGNATGATGLQGGDIIRLAAQTVDKYDAALNLTAEFMAAGKYQLAFSTDKESPIMGETVYMNENSGNYEVRPTMGDVEWAISAGDEVKLYEDYAYLNDKGEVVVKTKGDTLAIKTYVFANADDYLTVSSNKLVKGVVGADKYNKQFLFLVNADGSYTMKANANSTPDGVITSKAEFTAAGAFGTTTGAATFTNSSATDYTYVSIVPATPAIAEDPFYATFENIRGFISMNVNAATGINEGALASEGLTLLVDTTAANGTSYYIIKELGDKKLFLYNSTDSVKVFDEYTATTVVNPAYAMPGYTSTSDVLPMAVFVEAAYASEGKDTLTVGDATVATAANLEKGVKAGLNNFKFSMSETEAGSGEYYIMNNGKYLYSSANVLGFQTGTTGALAFTIEKQGTPTANEGTPSVSAMTVIAKDGAIEVVGAAGKKVVVSNILGQVIANTVVTSDNATIAAPAGIVVVAVEGEAAVKAIVK